MRYSLRSVCWCVVIVSLVISLMVSVYKDMIAASDVEVFTHIETREKSLLRALHEALDKEFSQGWSLERDKDGTLFVRPRSE